MRASITRRARFVAVAALSCTLAIPVAGVAQDRSSDANRGVEIHAELAEGLPIGLVYVHLRQSTGDLAKDEELKAQVATAFAARRGGAFRQVVAGFGLKRVRRLATVQSAEMRLFNTVPSGQVAVALLVSPRTQAPAEPAEASEAAAPAEATRFPTIHEDDRSKFVYILNGGVGVFSDIDPWFGGYGDAFNAGNPTAKDPLGPGASTWTEAYVEPGLGGISQVSDYPLYLYGAVSWLMSGTAGHDIYNSGNWGHGDFEKLYAGMIWNLPGWTSPSASRSTSSATASCCRRSRSPRRSASALRSISVLAWPPRTRCSSAPRPRISAWTRS